MPAKSPLRLAVLLSGNGSTLQNILDRCRDGRLNARVVLVVSNKADVGGLQRAADACVPSVVVERRDHDSLEGFSEAIFDHCRVANADLVCLAGFMQLVLIPDDFYPRVMNVHPALIPSFSGKGFYGHHVHEAVLQHGVKITGCTVHFANNEYDRGPIILQRAVTVHEDDTADSLAARVQEAEREAYPDAIQLYAEGRLRIEGNIVRVIHETSDTTNELG